jgi:hypothetical protein
MPKILQESVVGSGRRHTRAPQALPCQFRLLAPLQRAQRRALVKIDEQDLLPLFHLFRALLPLPTLLVMRPFLALSHHVILFQPLRSLTKRFQAVKFLSSSHPTPDTLVLKVQVKPFGFPLAVAALLHSFNLYLIADFQQVIKTEIPQVMLLAPLCG